MTRVVFAETARGDLEDIIDYIALDNIAAAERVYRRVIETAGQLAQFPNLGRPGRVPGLRELVVSGLPYLIAYDTGRGVVTVIAVFHTSRDLARALAERGPGPTS